MNRHVDDWQRLAYAEDLVDGTTAAFVELHLLRCAQCRADFAGESPTPPAALDQVWAGIRDRIETPSMTPIERAAVKLGLPAADARLLAAAPALRASWLGGLAAVCALALAAAWFGKDGSIALFLVVAPLAPLAGVANAYGPAADPAYEVTAATPYPSIRLLLLRAAAVLLTSVPIVALAAMLLPVGSGIAVGWLLPALAFALVVLALAAWIPITTSATAIALLWSVLVVSTTATHGTGAMVSLGVQPVYLSAAMVAAVALVVRTRHGT